MAKKKIPTHAEVKAQIEERKATQLAEERKKMITFLQQKTLKVLFTFQIGLEAMDFLVPTEFYQNGKDMKMHGNRFVKSLEKNVSTQIDNLYDNNPEFTINLFREIEEMLDNLAKLEFHDYPFMNQHIKDFLDNKEELSKKMQVQFTKLDSDK